MGEQASDQICNPTCRRAEDGLVKGVGVGSGLARYQPRCFVGGHVERNADEQMADIETGSRNG